MCAHLYRAKGGGWELFICRGPLRHDVLHYAEIIKVSGKREARKIAAERGATPWNF
jgi:hypothetical protein